MTPEEMMRDVVENHLIDILVRVVNGELDANGKHDLAVEILKYVQQQRATGADLFVLGEEVRRLWNSDEPKYYGVTPCHLETAKDQDGVERLIIVLDVPPIPTAVPLPVIPPSDIELLARREQFGPSPVLSPAPIPASIEEQKAVAVINLVPATPEKLEQIRQARPLTTIEAIELQIAEERELRARYAACQENLARLRALQDQQA